MEGKEFGLQFDEVTKSNNDAHFICYVHCLDDNIIVDDMASLRTKCHIRKTYCTDF